MNDIARLLYRGALGTTLTATLATVPSGVMWIVRNIVITSAPANAADVPAVTVSLSGQPLLAAIDVPTKSVFTLDCAQLITAGEAITGGGSLAGLTCHISGIEVLL